MPTQQQECLEMGVDAPTFHIGIFHFLGHLLENINHYNGLGDEQLLFSEKTTVKKSFDTPPTSSYFIAFEKLALAAMGVKSLRAPPYQASFSQQLHRPYLQLRAPPRLA